MRRVMTAFAVTVVLGAAAQAAAASTLAIVEPAFRATWRTLTFSATEESRVSCPLTLEGRFVEGTFAKTSGARIGSVRRATLGECAGGTARVLTETLPWTTQYSSFAGTLPDITSVTMRTVGGAFQIHPTGLSECLARTEERSPLVTIAERNHEGIVTGLRVDESATIPLTGGVLCSLVRGKVSGTAELTAAGERAGLSILLGEEGEALADREAAEGETLNQQPLPQLTIPAGSPEGTRGIVSRNSWYRVTITGIALIGANSEKFQLLTEEAAACRASFVLLVNRTNACNVRVRVRPEFTRPFSSRVNIVYQWGVFFVETSHQEMVVRAET